MVEGSPEAESEGLVVGAELSPKLPDPVTEPKGGSEAVVCDVKVIIEIEEEIELETSKPG
jgi:hypothetical protein